MFFKNRRKKKFYRKVMADSDRGIWNLELNIRTIESIKEDFRREYDRLGEMAKAHEEAAEKLMEKLGITVRVTGKKEDKNMRKELEKIVKNYKEEELAGLNPETRDKFINEAAKETRNMRMNWIRQKLDKKVRGSHGKERKKIEEEIEKKGARIVELLDMKAGFEKDAQKTIEQMEGKWNEKEGKRIGGLDQKIQEQKEKIAGGLEYKGLVYRELKKL